MSINKHREHRFASVNLLLRHLNSIQQTFLKLNEIPHAGSPMHLPRIRSFVDFRLLDALEALSRHCFSGC